jgi:hypothetical protein
VIRTNPTGNPPPPYARAEEDWEYLRFGWRIAHP